MSEDQLRLGVVRLSLEGGDELSVRASDIVACIGPSEEKRIRDGLIAHQRAQIDAQQMLVYRDMERAMRGHEGLLGVPYRVAVDVDATPNRLNQAYAIATNPTRSDTRVIVLRSMQQVYHVTNSREEIEGWMRDE
jgi:hypothetical protein